MASAGDLPKFASSEEEAAWYRERLEECQLELEEFQVSSKELEAELETQLTQLEKENRELRASKQKTEHERDLYADKFTLVTTELKSQLEQLEEDLRQEKECNERLSRHIRGLEQHNDDLERAKRALAASLEEFESRLNNAIERNAFLESELDEKEQLSAMVQRLKEETRDLKQELHVQKRHPPCVVAADDDVSTAVGAAAGASASLVNHQHQSNNNHNNRRAETPGAGNAGSGVNSPYLAGSDSAVSCQSASRNNGSERKKPLTASGGRANALDIVNDLLRKVGTLMNVALTPPPARRRSRSNSKRFFEANNNNNHITNSHNSNGSDQTGVLRDKATTTTTTIATTKPTRAPLASVEHSTSSISTTKSHTSRRRD